MGFLFSTKGSIISDSFKLVQTVGGLPVNSMVDVAIYNDRVEMTALNKNIVKLPLQKITDVYYGMEHEIVEKNKSVIGRAVAGGLLFGGTGAIVGAISGTGATKKKKTKFVFIISYTDSEGNTVFIPFEDVRLYKGTKVYKQLRSMINIPDNVIKSH